MVDISLFLDAYMIHNPRLILAWLLSLSLYALLMGRSFGTRTVIPVAAYSLLGYLHFWIPYYTAGGAPSFYGVFTDDTVTPALLQWIVLVLPTAGLMVPALALAEYVRRRILIERAMQQSYPGFRS